MNNLDLERRWLLRFCIQRAIAAEVDAADSTGDIDTMLRTPRPGSIVALVVHTLQHFPALNELHDPKITSALHELVREAASTTLASSASIQQTFILNVTSLLYKSWTRGTPWAAALRGPAAPSADELLDLVASTQATEELHPELRNAVAQWQENACTQISRAISTRYALRLAVRLAREAPLPMECHGSTTCKAATLR